MKKALISPNEPVELGYRVAEVADQSFEVAPPLFWIECTDDVVAGQFYYDPVDTQIKAVPVVVAAPVTPIGSAPNVIA